MKNLAGQAHSIVSIKQTTRGSLPRLPFEEIAKRILGPNYELSLVLCGDSLAQRMNKEYRRKTYKPNVLSFPISKHEGEIFLNVHCAAREAKNYNVSLRKHLALLFVHGCYHLKGLDHESEREAKNMERLETKTLERFGL
ncbi:MAG: rRNA maturation RNase YbeY [Candidatus Pacebacteria bacterium]|nr:rRNA maturation RNase YbeY [Candidatus Paceibacterota bacterium]